MTSSSSDSSLMSASDAATSAAANAAAMIETEAKLNAFAARSFDRRFMAVVVDIHTQLLQRGHGCAWGLGDDLRDLDRNDIMHETDQGLDDPSIFATTTTATTMTKSAKIPKNEEKGSLLPLSRTDQRAAVKLGSLAVTAVPETVLATIDAILRGFKDAVAMKSPASQAQGSRRRRFSHFDFTADTDDQHGGSEFDYHDTTNSREDHDFDETEDADELLEKLHRGLMRTTSALQADTDDIQDRGGIMHDGAPSDCPFVVIGGEDTAGGDTMLDDTDHRHRRVKKKALCSSSSPFFYRALFLDEFVGVEIGFCRRYNNEDMKNGGSSSGGVGGGHHQAMQFVVTAVHGSAARRGVQVGDVVLAIDHQPLADALEMSNWTNSSEVMRTGDVGEVTRENIDFNNSFCTSSPSLASFLQHLHRHKNDALRFVDLLLARSPRPLVVTFRREYSGSSSSSSNYNDGNAAMSGTDVEKPPEQSLESISNQKSLRGVEVALEVAQLSVLLLHGHRLFAFAHFSDISLQASLRPAGPSDGHKRDGVARNRNVASRTSIVASVHAIEVLDLTARGARCRCVVAREFEGANEASSSSSPSSTPNEDTTSSSRIMDQSGKEKRNQQPMIRVVFRQNELHYDLTAGVRGLKVCFLGRFAKEAAGYIKGFVAATVSAVNGVANDAVEDSHKESPSQSAQAATGPKEAKSDVSSSPPRPPFRLEAEVLGLTVVVPRNSKSAEATCVKV